MKKIWKRVLPVLIAGLFIGCGTAPEVEETISSALGQQRSRQQVYHLILRNNTLADALTDIQLTSQMAGIEMGLEIIGDAEIPLTLTIEERSLERLINRLSIEAECLAVRRGNHYTVYANGADEIMAGEPMSYVYKFKALPLDVAEAQIEDIAGDVLFRGIPENNSITLTGTVDEVKKVVFFLETIDQEGDVVLIELLIVQYRHGQKFNWGFDISAGTVGSLSNMTFLPGSDEKSGFTYKFLQMLDPQFTLNLSLLIQDNLAKVITNPHIAVKNGNEAEIRLEQSKWVRLKSAYDLDTATWMHELSELNAGVELRVTPRIAVNGLISLEVNGSLSVFLPTTGEEYAIDTNTVSTQINVMDGQTLIIGGLIKREETVSEGGIPLLRSIPVLGYLFRREARKFEYFETVLYITPHVYPLKSYEQLGSRDYIHYLLGDMADREKIIEENL